MYDEEDDRIMKYKLVIFDMDGTILDTLEDLKDCLNHALEQNAFPVRTLEEVRNFVGNGIRKLVERAVPAGTDIREIDSVFSDFQIYYKLHCTDKTKPYAGIAELLRTLRQQGIKTAVVSNKIDFAVQDLVLRYFDGLFDMAVGDRPGMARKPAPDSVYAVLDGLHIDKEACVYVGDSDVDIDTARNAGLDSIIVTWGFRDREFLAARGASVFAEKPEDVLMLLDGKAR